MAHKYLSRPFVAQMGAQTSAPAVPATSDNLKAERVQDRPSFVGEYLRKVHQTNARSNIAPLQAKAILADSHRLPNPHGHRSPTLDADGPSPKGLVAQPSATATSVLQMDTDIKHYTGTVNVSGANYTVGEKMEASLDPDDPVKGSATGPNWVWMQTIRKAYPAANVVRGHLLNHDLGGYAVQENLYPISTKANTDHSKRVEQNVKKALRNAHGKSKPKPIINYQVNVKKELNAPENASFECAWTDETGKKFNDTIPSKLGNDTGGWGGSGSETSPVAWQHGKRRGEEDWTTQVSALNAKISVIPNLLAPKATLSKVDSESQQLIMSILSAFDIDEDLDDLEDIFKKLVGKKPEAIAGLLQELGYNVTPKATRTLRSGKEYDMDTEDD